MGKLKNVLPTAKRAIKPEHAHVAKFDFRALDIDFNSAYAAWKKDKSEQNRINLYQAAFELAYACIKVSRYRRNDERDIRALAAEFAFTQLARIVEGRFRPEARIPGTSFPADKYFSLALRRPSRQHFTRDLPNEKWANLHVFIEDLEMFVNDNAGRISSENEHGEKAMDKVVTMREYSRDLFNALRLLYSEDEIRRLLPLASEILFTSDLLKMREPQTAAPRDLQVFMDVLIVCAQRLAVEHDLTVDINLPKKDIKQMLEKSLRSTIFLAAVSNYEKVPRDLLLSVDHRTLYRLAYTMGGKTIRIPTVREIDSLQKAIQGAVAVYLAPDAERKQALANLKNLDSVLVKKRGRPNSADIVAKIIHSNRILHDDDTSSTPIINVILSGIRALDQVINRMGETSLTPNQTLNQYVTLSKSLTEIVDKMIELERNNGRYE